jgi:two-component sensor histidine kinase
MVLHELATNAAKHGALSTPEGRVRIRWRTAAGRLHARWEESGGPPVEKPERRGFGTTVLQRAFAGALRGEIRLDWRREGLACELQLPLERGANPDEPV